MPIQPRRPGDQTFRKNDLRRAIATANAMKLPLKGIVVNRDGFELVVGDSEPTTQPNEWDEPTPPAK